MMEKEPPPALTEEALLHVDRVRSVVLLCNDQQTRFAVPRKSLLRYSKLMASMFGDEYGGANIEVPMDEDIPLDDEHCRPEIIALLKIWLDHYESTTPLPLQRPLPLDIAVCPLSEWDRRYVETFLAPDGDMKQHMPLYELSCIAVYLDIGSLADMCCAYLAWKMRHVVYETTATKTDQTVTSSIRGWFGMEGDFTKREMEQVVKEHEWAKEITYDDIMTKMLEEEAAAASKVGDS